MNKKLVDSLFSFNLILVVGGLIGHIFFYWVQENFYTQPNFLKPIEDLLNNQTSATTYFVVLSSTATQMILVLFITMILDSISFGLKVIGHFLAPIIPFAVYCFYEYQQMLNPPYPDNHILDMVVAGLALLTFWVGYAFIFAKNKGENSD